MTLRDLLEKLNVSDTLLDKEVTILIGNRLHRIDEVWEYHEPSVRSIQIEASFR